MKVIKITLTILMFFALLSLKTFAQDVPSTPHVLSMNHGGNVQCVAYHPDGLVLVSGGVDKAVREIKNRLHLWNAITGENLDTSKWHNDDINCLAFSPNGVWLASGDNDGQVLFSKLGPNNQSLEEFQGEGLKGLLDIFKNNVKSVTFSPDSSMLVCGMSGGWFSGGDIFVFYYDGEKWGNRKVLTGHNGDVNSVAFIPINKKDDSSEDGSIFASASSDGTIKLWDARIGNHLNTLDKEHTDSVNSIAFNKTGEFLASGSSDGTVILWKKEDSDQYDIYDRPLGGHTSDVRSVAFSRSGEVLAGGNADKTIGVWGGIKGDYRTLLEVHTDSVNGIAFNPKMDVMASAGDDGMVYQSRYIESTNIDDSTISLTSPPDLIQDFVSTTDATYFILHLEYPKLEGVNEAYIRYGDCILTLDLPWLPSIPVDPSNPSDPHIGILENPVSYMYAMHSPQQLLDQVKSDRWLWVGAAWKRLLASGTGALVGLKWGAKLGPKGAFIGAAAGFIVGGVTHGTALAVDSREEAAILESTADPIFLLHRLDFTEKADGEGTQLGRPLGYLEYLFLIRSNKVASDDREIKLKVQQEWRQSKQAGVFWFGPTDTESYEDTFDLETGTWAKAPSNQVDSIMDAPGIRSMSLSDYPPFQQLPPEVQAYLLRQFGESASTRDVRDWQIPEETSLLPNYPNPFNPETWIPYQLAEPADVTLTIYDIQGRVVRDLNFGHQRAGMYHSRSRAAHWDGRNVVGEPVASGVYFYTLTAGEFTATRKMLIRK